MQKIWGQTKKNATENYCQIVLGEQTHFLVLPKFEFCLNFFSPFHWH